VCLRNRKRVGSCDVVDAWHVIGVAAGAARCHVIGPYEGGARGKRLRRTGLSAFLRLDYLASMFD
jgi:hypothetical protein